MGNTQFYLFIIDIVTTTNEFTCFNFKRFVTTNINNS